MYPVMLKVYPNVMVKKNIQSSMYLSKRFVKISNKRTIVGVYISTALKPVMLLAASNSKYYCKIWTRRSNDFV